MSVTSATEGCRNSCRLSPIARFLMLRAWAIAPVVVFLASCATNKSFVNYGQKYPPNSETVKVFPPSEPVDAGCTRIGEIHIYDSGFSTGCGYDSVLEQAKKAASQNGGNAF